MTTQLTLGVQEKGHTHFEFVARNPDNKELYLACEGIDYALSFFTRITEGKPFKWLSPTKIELKRSGLTVECPRLEEVIEDGEETELSQRTEYRILRFLGQSTSEIETPPVGARSDEIPLERIAREFGLTPSAARRILRKEGVDKPGSRWAWDEKGADEPRAALRKNVKVKDY